MIDYGRQHAGRLGVEPSTCWAYGARGFGPTKAELCQRRLKMNPLATGWFPAVIATLGGAARFAVR